MPEFVLAFFLRCPVEDDGAKKRAQAAVLHQKPHHQTVLSSPGAIRQSLKRLRRAGGVDDKPIIGFHPTGHGFRQPVRIATAHHFRHGPTKERLGIRTQIEDAPLPIL